MPNLRITRLDPKEIHALATCNSASELIAVQLDAKGKPKIVTIAKSEVTCWQLFLKFFGFGKLANTEVHLYKLVAHLNEYDWKEAAKSTLDSDAYRAYLKVCSLANSALARKENDTLYNNVALETADVRITQHGRPFTGYSLKWNPALQYKHIIDPIRNKYRYCTEVTVERPHSYSHPERESFVGREDLRHIKINIGRRAGALPYYALPRNPVAELTIPLPNFT